MNRLPAKSTRLIVEESNRVGVQFLLADLATAVTFLNAADVTQSDKSRRRNRQNALTAYQTVLRLLPRVTPSNEEQQALTRQLDALKARLTAIGLIQD